MARIGKVGIIGGAGWLGMAISRALLRSGIVQSGDLICSYRTRHPDGTSDIEWTAENTDLVTRSDIIILSVRPADWPSIKIEARNKLVISVMAGVTIDAIRERTSATRIARALPNAAAELGYSYSPFHIVGAEPRDRETIRAIFEACGVVDEVLSEDDIDYFTAMSGSGAAFPALLAEAMANDAIARGIPAEIAVRAAQQVIVGAGRLQEAHCEVPADTVRAFVDYKGTTAAGIEAMRDQGFARAVRAGLEAAFRKARSLAGK